MDKAKQDKYREDLIDAYQKKAWECLANYDFFGAKYASIEQQAIGFKKRLDETELAIKVIQDLPDHHTVENREKVKALKKDCETFEKTLKSFGDPNGVMQKAFKESTAWREEGLSYLERAEFMRTFKLNTPEEIAANKEKVGTTSQPAPAPQQ